MTVLPSWVGLHHSPSVAPPPTTSPPCTLCFSFTTAKETCTTPKTNSLSTQRSTNTPYGFFLAELSPNTIAGCVLFRSLDTIPHAAECKRLFVLPQHRGHNIAARLMDTLEDTARASGIRYLYLDSKDNFQAAIRMYRRRNYTDCPRYNQNPQATIFLRKDLAPHED